ncbi:hypothetical protein C8Q70DRAFT_279469 [Cubamyces menziesii]|nr:hypothetical protein C8Q70DRAFT_279469 [Cubamyces menziesii]
MPSTCICSLTQEDTSSLKATTRRTNVLAALRLKWKALTRVPCPAESTATVHHPSLRRSYQRGAILFARLPARPAQLPPSDRTSPTPADRETRDIPGPQPQHLPPVLTRVPCPAESNAAVRVSNHAFLSFTHSLTIFRALLHLRPRLFDVSRDPTLCRTSSALAAYNVSVRAHTHYAQNSPRFVCSTSAGRWVPQSTVHAQANVSALVFACPRRRVPSRTGSATPPEPPTNHTSPTPANRETRDIGRKLPARKGSSTPPASPAAAHPARATGCWPSVHTTCT